MTANSQSEPKIIPKIQYIKDLSFENPNPVESLSLISNNQSKSLMQPQIDLKINKLTLEEHFEVEVRVQARASAEHDKQIFHIELLYGGIFQLVNMNTEQTQIVLSTRCPELLFPYVRNIISEVTQQGGLPPLMLEPIDFVKLASKMQFQLQESPNNDN